MDGSADGGDGGGGDGNARGEGIRSGGGGGGGRSRFWIQPRPPPNHGAGALSLGPSISLTPSGWGRRVPIPSCSLLKLKPRGWGGKQRAACEIISKAQCRQVPVHLIDARWLGEEGTDPIVQLVEVEAWRGEAASRGQKKE